MNKKILSSFIILSIASFGAFGFENSIFTKVSGSGAIPTVITFSKNENGVRYIYQTSQSKTDDGYDLMTFQKKKEDGTVMEEAKYKIMGSEPQLIQEEKTAKS